MRTLDDVTTTLKIKKNKKNSAAARRRYKRNEKLVDATVHKKAEMRNQQQQARGTRGVRAPSGNHYVVVNFKADMIGTVLTDEETVRAPNGRRWRPEDPPLMKEKSMLRCPTYGTCSMCMSSGPMNGYCRLCRSPGCFYRQVTMGNPGDEKMIDAEWISHFFRMTHLPAMADREVNPQLSQSNKMYRWSATDVSFQLANRDNWKNRPENWDDLDKQAKWRLVSIELMRFEDETLDDEAETWDFRNSMAYKLDPIADRNDPLPGTR
jgi:hypothetical protein